MKWTLPFSFVFIVACAGNGSVTKPEAPPVKEVKTPTTPVSTPAPPVEEEKKEEPEKPVEKEKPPTKLSCEAVLIKAWPLVDSVSKGTFTTTELANGEKHSVVDAKVAVSAAATKPFIYIDLNAGTPVLISDKASLNNDTWHIAFKRALIRINGGDSGPGNMQLARVTNTTFEAVTTVAAGTKWETDASLDPNTQSTTQECEVVSDLLGNPITAINDVNEDKANSGSSWFDYGGTGSLTPTPGEVYLLRDSGKTTVWKLQFESWSSGALTIRWVKLIQ